MTRYPKYKPSGIDWIGDIPEHWGIKRLGIIGIFTSSGIDKKIVEGEPLVKMINYTDVYGNKSKILDSKVQYMLTSCPDEKKIAHQVKKGDLIFTPSSETIEDIGLSALVDEELEGTVFSYHVLRFQFLEHVNHKYKKYLCNNHFVLNYFSSEAKGTTRQILGRDEFKNALILLPPLPEQTVIADYLDEKTAQIDDLIVKKQKLIDLLKEERTAIINHAVTKGIDPHARLKPSGIEWLGDIPEHWEVKKLKYVAFMKSGLGISSNEIKDVGNYPVYGGNGIRGYASDFSHEGNFVLIGRQGALCGNINYAIGKFWASEHAIVVTMIDKHNFFWLGELLTIMNLNQYSMSAAQPGLAVENIRNLLVPIPPKNEQQLISEYIQSETQKIDAIIEREIKAIELLQEYRMALISEVVTGKVKVLAGKKNDLKIGAVS